MLETDRDAITAARRDAGAQIARLKTAVAAAGRRLADLERGRRIARAADAMRGLRQRGAGAGEASLEEAEATLRRLRERQAEDDAVEASLSEFESTAGGTLADRLEAAGFGKPTRPTAVLDRLKARVPDASSH